MAQKFVTDEGELIIPGAYASIRVEKQNSGLSSTGVLFLVGEADAGPDWTLETDLAANFFTPDEIGDVSAKYRSGRLVDAFRAAAQPANDVAIRGSPSRIYLIKTNKSTKASASLTRAGLTAYGAISDKSYGALGNMLYAEVVAADAEVAPRVGPFNLALASSASLLGLRINGAAKVSGSAAANASPAAFVTALNALAGVLATGGINRAVLSGAAGYSLAVAASGNNVTVTISAGVWGTIPTAGDMLIVPATGDVGAGANSPIIGAASANRGSYVITAATATTISATKIRDAAASLTPPVAVAPQLGVSTTADIQVFSPITITNVTGTDRSLVASARVTDASTIAVTVVGTEATFDISTGWSNAPRISDYLQIPTGSAIAGGGSANVGWYKIKSVPTATRIVADRLSDGNPAAVGAADIAATTDLRAFRPAIDGTGKAIEFFDNAGAVSIEGRLFDTSAIAFTGFSKTNTPAVVASTLEYKANLKILRAFDGVSEELAAGGTVALRVGYFGTTATMTITGTALTTTVTGGAGANLSVALKDFARISDLAAWINSQTGYTASLATTLVGQLKVTYLDEGTYGICAEISGAVPGRVKVDAYQFFKKVSTGSATIALASEAVSGLPDLQVITYFAGGAKVGTLQADVIAAIGACSKLRGNFMIPLFSRDAADDILDLETEGTSTYTIDSINAYVRTHVNQMSTLKKRRNRLGIASKQSTFAAVRLAANDLASARMCLVSQQFKATGSDGALATFQPWMGAVLAAGMQAAGFYRAIFNKGINCSGILWENGEADFSDQEDADLEEALTNGLLVATRPEEGGFKWVSDQTTYGVDDNFVYNSLQAMYVADVIALTAAQRMERAFKGESVADVSAAVALGFFEGIMRSFKDLKLIAASADAPKGYKNVTISIKGPAMKVSCEVKLAGAIYFIPISFLVSQVEQSAAA